jgi:hypothetical protein
MATAPGLRLPQCLGGAVTHGNNLELFVFLNYRTFPDGENGFTWAGSHFAGFDWFTKTPRRLSGGERPAARGFPDSRHKPGPGIAKGEAFSPLTRPRQRQVDKSPQRTGRKRTSQDQ